MSVDFSQLFDLFCVLIRRTVVLSLVTLPSSVALSSVSPVTMLRRSIANRFPLPWWGRVRVGARNPYPPTPALPRKGGEGEHWPCLFSKVFPNIMQIDSQFYARGCYGKKNSTRRRFQNDFRAPQDAPRDGGAIQN